MNVRLLAPGDEDALIVAARQFNEIELPPALALALLRDPTFLMVVAHDENGTLLGRIYAHELRRLDQTDLFLYEVDVEDAHRRKGVCRAMLKYLGDLCVERGYGEMFVLTEVSNKAGNGVYRAAGSVLDGSPANVHVFFTPGQ